MAGVAEIENLILHRIANREPFSMVRVGDGEAMFLQDPRFFPPQARLQILQTWFGRFDFDRVQIEHLVNGLQTAVKNADVLCFPQEEVSGFPAEGISHLMANTSQYYNEIFRNVQENKLISNLGAAVSLYESGSLDKILKTTDWCGIIGSRDITTWIEQRCGAQNYTWYKIPTEQYHSLSSDTTHFPDRYSELINEINIPHPGAVFVIGAGVCGKIYCDHVRKLGGIAIDIGSVFDLIAGKNTRQYIANSINYDLMNADLDVEGCVDRALKFESEGKLDLASKLSEFAISKDPDYAPAYYALALINLRRANLAKAIYNINSAIDLNSRISKYWTVKGRIEMDLSDLKSAEKTLRIARSLRFTDGDTLIYLSQVCAAGGRKEEALGFAAEALAYSPEHTFGRVNMLRTIENIIRSK